MIDFLSENKIVWFKYEQNSKKENGKSHQNIIKRLGGFCNLK